MIFMLMACGAFSGFLAGLLGVGGGILLVPALFWVVHSLQYSDYPMHVAVATSLANIVLTGSRSAWSHFHHGNIDHAVLKAYALPIMCGTALGILVALQISSVMLQLIFGVVAMCLAAIMLMKPVVLHQGMPRMIIITPMVTLFGLISSLVGIGGGSLVVPSLTAFGYPILRAIGSAAALGVCIAVPSTIGFALLAHDHATLPDYSIGFIWLPGLVLTSLASVLVAPWGSAVANTIPPVILRRLFAVFLFVVGSKLLFHGTLI